MTPSRPVSPVRWTENREREVRRFVHRLIGRLSTGQGRQEGLVGGTSTGTRPSSVRGFVGGPGPSFRINDGTTTTITEPSPPSSHVWRSSYHRPLGASSTGYRTHDTTSRVATSTPIPTGWSTNPTTDRGYGRGESRSPEIYSVSRDRNGPPGPIPLRSPPV